VTESDDELEFVGKIGMDITGCTEHIWGNFYRTKMREEKEEHAVLLSVLLIMNRGERSGGVCQPATFGAPRWFSKLRKLNEILIT
jgi:hypothetical protein